MSDPGYVWLEGVVASANFNRYYLSDTDSLRRLIDSAEIVIGVWQDFDEPNGVGHLVIKGKKRLTSTSDTCTSLSMTVQGVPCECLEEAIAIERVFGDAMDDFSTVLH